MSAFGNSKAQTPKNLARDVRRSTGKSQREIQREIDALGRQEKVLIAEIKKAAKQGSSKATHLYAKQLAQLRESRTRMQGMQTQVNAVGLQATTLAAQAGAVEAMGRTAAVVGAVASKIDPAKVAAALQRFQRESARMDLNTEALDEFLDDAFDNDEAEEEADGIVQQTLLEIGVDLNADMVDAPGGAPVTAGAGKNPARTAKPAAAAAAAEEEDPDTAELEARFSALSS
mmetsp:Transcript_24598/g.55417  ORF Transcript_24598/g.55417 Transcript_24598/m.55417 type:complete len:230 (-) Transcript_24598:62-751(-)|eukprot:CAMPEP_0172587968 /NCGR_PEP_ID=MMETSP1068-20121228/6937_1 /TAXON_ID=35684 /ORGANISM="Pseudopedinella elastica, Strain CCMP716" /LENGTH=229 /DNA_ID=CAMNT_0013383149 /DNA_START=113 /DNA_END=802 /DNA_ORIENTATION=+